MAFALAGVELALNGHFLTLVVFIPSIPEPKLPAPHLRRKSDLSADRLESQQCTTISLYHTFPIWQVGRESACRTLSRRPPASLSRRSLLTILVSIGFLRMSLFLCPTPQPHITCSAHPHISLLVQ